MEFYFEYNYLQSKFPIYSNQHKVIGKIELHEFHSFVTHLEYATEWKYRGQLLIHEKSKSFSVITNTWQLFDRKGTMQGVMKERIFSLGRRYNYLSNNEFKYSFISKPFSKNYRVVDGKDTLIASVNIKYGVSKNKVNLLIHGGEIDLVELITALTGVIVLDRKRNQ